MQVGRYGVHYFPEIKHDYFCCIKLMSLWFKMIPVHILQGCFTTSYDYLNVSVGVMKDMGKFDVKPR